jgi:hypothetical protein
MMLDEIYEVDGKRLNVMVWGQAGSGKSYFLEQTASAYLSKNKDPMYRVLYIAPKGEGFESLLAKKQKPVTTYEDMEKSLINNRVTVYYPPMDGLDENVDDALNLLFDLRESNEGLKTVVIIDDAQVFLSSRKAASNAHKRVALTGRSRGIRAVYVSHNIVFARELEGQISHLVGFSNPNPIYYKQAIERFNFDPAPFQEDINSKEYSFVYFDVTKQPVLMSPIGE